MYCESLSLSRKAIYPRIKQLIFPDKMSFSSIQAVSDPWFSQKTRSQVTLCQTDGPLRGLLWDSCEFERSRLCFKGPLLIANATPIGLISPAGPLILLLRACTTCACRPISIKVSHIYKGRLAFLIVIDFFSGPHHKSLALRCAYRLVSLPSSLHHREYF